MDKGVVGLIGQRTQDGGHRMLHNWRVASVARHVLLPRSSASGCHVDRDGDLDVET